MKIYRREGQTAERPHLRLPAGTFEEEIGLEGFYGVVSHLYHRNAPTDWSAIDASSFQWPKREAVESGFLKPQCFGPITKTRLPQKDFYTSASLLLWNDDVSLFQHAIEADSKTYFRNADASELYFCHEGSASLESSFGSLEIKKSDYVVVPKGVTYRWKIHAPSFLLRIESFQSAFQKPETGILGQQALYHEENIRVPVFKPMQEEKESIVRIQNEGKLTEVRYGFDLRDVAGWFGTLYPYALNALTINPILSNAAHLPPSVNSTFLGKGFVVCTFLPRPLEEWEGALRVPFFHSNIDYDEVIFYHDGDFFSRDHIEKGSITLHPRGINHGPHPKALQNQMKKTRTDEVAVMIDTVKPLKVSSFARKLEIEDYWKSWSRK